MATRFVKKAGEDTVYENKGGGILDPIATWEDFTKRGGSKEQINEFNDLGDVYNQEIEQNVNSQIDPLVRSAETSAEEERKSIESSSKTILDALTKAYEQASQSDPYARSGFVSGQANAVRSDRQTTQIKEVSQDVADKLSSIARRLSDVKTGAAASKVSLTDTLKDKYRQNQVASEDRKRAIEGERMAAGEERNAVQAVDMGDRIAFVRSDGSIVKEVKKGLTPSAAAGNSYSSRIGTPKANAQDLQTAIATAITSGQYTATGEAGKKSREQLIAELAPLFASSTSIKPADIATAVYSGFRGNTEAAFTGLQQSAIDQVNSLSGKAPDKPTEGNLAAAGYAKRVENSNQSLGKYDSFITGLSPAQFALYKVAPNMAKPAEYQAWESAAKDFVAANLRKESGAAISPSEFSDAIDRYIPAPGDKPAKLEEKARIRRDILEGLVTQSGSAYKAQDRPSLNSFVGN